MANVRRCWIIYETRFDTMENRKSDAIRDTVIGATHEPGVASRFIQERVEQTKDFYRGWDNDTYPKWRKVEVPWIEE